MSTGVEVSPTFVTRGRASFGRCARPRSGPGGAAFVRLAEGDTEAIHPPLVAALAELEPAYLQVVFADPDQPVFQEIRRLWTGTLIANPNLGWEEPPPTDGGRHASEPLLAAGADLISLGRAFLANPDLVDRRRTGAPLNPIRDAYLMYTGEEEGYSDYPTLAPDRDRVLASGSH
ncbi:hypothetical protein [Embleya sp. NPDC059237]|uniref:hypothetical protein n=1 Tax=Embleya sp. NPDC059237 TaxID=3346784 RepID=UPI0036777561